MQLDLTPILEQMQKDILVQLRAEIEPTPWRTTAEVAEYLRCQPQRVFDLVHTGRLKVYKENGRSLYHIDDVKAMIV